MGPREVLIFNIVNKVDRIPQRFLLNIAPIFLFFYFLNPCFHIGNSFSMSLIIEIYRAGAELYAIDTIKIPFEQKMTKNEDPVA